MRYFKTFFLLFASFFVSRSFAQILPPQLDCIRGDTIFWTPVVNNCGAFVSTDIFYSASPGGTYNLLIQITDPNVTSFHHPVMGDAYYYLQ